MQTVHHPLTPAMPGSSHQLTSLHFGTPGQGPKTVVQASLHADEAPGMLVAQHLRQRLATLEAQGRLRGEVVLVPTANPLGLGQWTLRGHLGRFEACSGENFNRGFADLRPQVLQAVQGRLGDDSAANVALVRAALRSAVAALPAPTPLHSLRRALHGLACDADLVLDLHCDGEAVLHLYTTPQCWPGLQPLARCLGAQAVLLAEHSGGEPFDEACSMLWPQLAAELAPATPLPQACLAVTIELRGEADVRHDLAAADAEGILRFLALRGQVDAQGSALADDPPALACEATPLAGSMPIVAPHGGVLVFLREPGAWVQAGEAVAELLEPIAGTLTPLVAPVSGLFFARENRRVAVAGMSVGKVAGQQARRAGALLSP